MVLFVDRGGTSTKVFFLSFPNVSIGDPLCFKPGFPIKTFGNDGWIKKLRKFLRTLPQKPEFALVGSRGVWSQAERTALRKKLLFLAKTVEVVSDIELAHYLSFGKKPGIVLNAGTGSIALGRNKKGQVARSGGLGPMLGDEGSAYWIGREFLKATKDVSFLRKLNRNKDGVKKIASYAQNALRSNSKVAKKIQKEGLAHLTRLITKVQSILKIEKPTPVALKGGLFNNNSFRMRLTRRLRKLRFHV